MSRPRTAAPWAAALAAGAFAAAAGAVEAPGPDPTDPAWLAERPAHRALARLRARQAPLAPFQTDGCSGGLSAVWSAAAERFPHFAAVMGGAPPWEACCIAHDRLYHDAGPDPSPEASFLARLAADETLEACVRETGAREAPTIAALNGMTEDEVLAAYDAAARAMFLAVRAGGAPCSGLPWRWGYGYPQCAAAPRDVFPPPERPGAPGGSFWR